MIRALKFLPLPLLFATPANGLIAAQPPTINADKLGADDVQQEIANALERVASLAGLSVAVYSPDLRFAQGFGHSDFDVQTKATANTSFYIASSTKSMMALVLAKLHERGEIDLDQPIAQFAPDALFPKKSRAGEATLRDLLAQRSGIINNPIVHRTAFSGEHDAETLWRLLEATERNKRNKRGAFQYSNHNYNIATLLVERKLGKHWKTLLQEELFDPAGMSRTSANISAADQPGWSLARSHTSLSTSPPKRTYLEKADNTMHSAGGVVMSANDAAKWLELMIEDGRFGGQQIIPVAAVQASRRPLSEVGSTFEGFDRAHYGLGWYIGAYRGGPDRLIHHFGGFTGARAHVSYIPERKWGVAVFANGSQAGFRLADIIANYVYDRLEGRSDATARLNSDIDALITWNEDLSDRVNQAFDEADTRKQSLTQPPADYAGRYVNRDYGTVDIQVQGDRLFIKNGNLHALARHGEEPDTVRAELIPLSADTISFRLKRGRVTSLDYKGVRFEKIVARKLD